MIFDQNLKEVKVKSNEEDETKILNKLFSNPETLYEIWEKHISSSAHAIFFYRSLIRSIDAYLSQDYLAFDAHTTSNCCHGMALLSRLIIISIRNFNLLHLRDHADKLILEIERSVNTEFSLQSMSIKNIDWRLLVLLSLHVLTTVGEIDPQKGRRTLPQKLKEISPIGTMFADALSSHLQKYFSNKVAYSYEYYLKAINNEFNISGAPVKMWGQYIKPEYFRTSIRGVTFAPCLYSTQVVLAYLISYRVKLAFVNEIMNFNNELQGRYVRIFEGNGHNGFRLLTEKEISFFEPYDFYEPTIVFSGCAFLEYPDIKSIAFKLSSWIHQISNLILACDIFYPQFPKVTIDPNFNSTPIIPKEDILKNIIHEYSKVEGVSAENPSLFCLTHIFSASLGKILALLKGNGVLPLSSIYFPHRLLKPNPSQKLQAS